MQFANFNCDKICIENPIGYMSTHYRKPDQIIQPYEYGATERKATCLWLKGLPKLKPTNIVKPDIVRRGNWSMSRVHYDTFKLPPAERARIRSQTFQGIADAMADQWG